ncbi:CHC2 zinc finger domain-containing protein [Alicyclobacillus fodiniaquatilis]|uniref:CHC2 zinc finger domain-containing protein n=1 Tax=Alicyclobacillus fodiniaquatilis TaxID=1661150 RepID=A0ABW4JKS6_9BACL
MLIGIEEVARRNDFQLFKTGRPDQWKAHCPDCGDKGRQYHLYVNTAKDQYHCVKCHASGGVVHFHAWLRKTSFEEAKNDLYPPNESKRRRPLHPAEKLSKEQLNAMGFTLKTPTPIPPKGVDGKRWYARRRRELDWIWSEWLEHLAHEKAMDEAVARLMAESERNTAALEQKQSVAS